MKGCLLVLQGVTDSTSTQKLEVFLGSIFGPGSLQIIILCTKNYMNIPIPTT